MSESEDKNVHEIVLGPKKRHKVLISYKNKTGKIEILLLKKRDEEKWELPGGEAEKSETPEEAIVREIHEETGIQKKHIRLNKNPNILEEQLPHRKRIDITFTLNLIQKPDITLSDEHSDYKWVTLPEALTMNLRKKTRKVLSDSNLKFS